MHLWISKLRKRNLQEISNFEYVTNARKIRNWRKEKKLNQRIKIKNYTFTNFEERSVFSPRAEFPFSRLPSRRYPFSPNHVASSDVTARSYGISWNGLVYLRRRSATRCSTRTSQEFLFPLPSLSFFLPPCSAPSLPLDPCFASCGSLKRYTVIVL